MIVLFFSRLFNSQRPTRYNSVAKAVSKAKTRSSTVFLICRLQNSHGNFRTGSLTVIVIRVDVWSIVGCAVPSDYIRLRLFIRHLYIYIYIYSS